MINDHGHLYDIHVEHDIEDDRGMMVNQGGVFHLVVAAVKWGKGVKDVKDTRESRGGAVKVAPRALISNIESAH